MSTSTTIIMAIIISFAVSVILCPIVIPILKKMKFGQYIREVGPKSHQSKTGTPTMGGMIILAGVIVTSLIFMIVEKNTKIAPVLFMTVGFGLIGFIDDYIKVVKKRNLGLIAGCCNSSFLCIYDKIYWYINNNSVYRRI